ncbi:hypothetical protein ACFL1W_01195 [Candidatus Margulisiibacteriota bacterium]
MNKLIKIVFTALLFVFALILSFMFGLFSGRIFLALIALLLTLGIALVALTIRQKVAGKLKLFLLLTGGSAAGFVVFSVLHNLLYALLGFEEPVCFLVAVVVCPVTFIIGAVGSIVMIVNENRSVRGPLE